MPKQQDYDLGKKAVEQSLISQDQLEEAIMDLCALERVGSKRDLAEILVKKGFLNAAQLQKLKGGVPKPSARPKPQVEKKPAPPPEKKEKAEAPRSPLADTAPPASKPVARPIPRNAGPGPKEPLPASLMKTPVTLPSSNASEYCFIQTLGQGQARVRVLPKKPIAIGREPANDIVVLDGPVSKRHARLTFSPDGMTLWDVGSKNGTFVNDEKITSKKLKEGDVVGVGNCYLIFARVSTPDGRIMGTITPNAPEQDAVALLIGKDGFPEGARFAVAANPLLIGSEGANNIRLEDPSVSPFHAQIAVTPDGVRVLDLNSATGVKANGEAVAAKLLEEGDIITIGKYTLHVDVVKQGPAGGAVKSIPATQPTTAALTPRDPVEAAEDAGVLAEAGPDMETVMAQRPDAAPKAKPEQDSDLLHLGAALRQEVGIGVKGVEEPACPGKCRLICIAGVIKTKSFPLATAKMTFGRNPASDVFLEDLSVSREHAMIKPAGDKLEIVDLGSRNGIEVNGRKVMTKMLNIGDKVKIGKNVFLIESTA